MSLAWAIALPLFLLVVGLLSYLALGNQRRARLIADTPTTKVAHLSYGLAEVEGRAVPLAEALVAPLSGRKCVYYRLKVEERRGGAKHRHWATVIDDVRHIDFGVADETGVVRLDPRGARLVLHPDTRERTGTFDQAPPEWEELLNRKYGLSTKGWLGEKSMRFTETIIEEGDPLYVLGHAEQESGGRARLGKGEGVLLISDREGKALEHHYVGYAVLLWVLAAVVTVGGVVIALSRLHQS